MQSAYEKIDETTPLLINTGSRTPEVQDEGTTDILKRAATLLYLLFLVFRFISLLMYTTFCVDCLLYQSSSSADCQNFTIYPEPFDWKAAWSAMSIVNLLLLFAFFASRASGDLSLLGPLAIVKELSVRPQFWTSVAQIISAVIYDGMIIAENANAHKLTEVLFIVMKFLTALMVYKLNFMLPPTNAEMYCMFVVTAYRMTLLCFAVDNLTKFFIESTEVVFKVYTFDPMDVQQPLKIVNLMLMIFNASLYAFFWHFLWNKLFCGKKDILTTFRSNFEDTLING